MEVLTVSDRPALLANILANPDDDTLRLIFADYLEEHGDPERASFIRLQCQLARLEQFDSRRELLKAEEKKILGEKGKRWLEEDGLAELLGSQHAEFRRGFVEHGSFSSCLRFCDLAPQIVERTPLQSVEVDVRDVCDRFLDAPILEKLRFLQIRERCAWDSHQSSGAVVQVLASKRLANLHTLNLQNAILDKETATALASASHLARLELLDLSYSIVGYPEFAHIADSLHLANLRELRMRTVGECVLGDPLAEILAHSPFLHNLKKLDLYRQDMLNDGLQHLATWPGLASLASLTVSVWDSEFDKPIADLRPLGNSVYWCALRELNLELTIGTLTPFAEFLCSPKLRSLHSLDVDLNPTAGDDDCPELDWDEAAGLLVACPHLENLRKLQLRYQFYPSEEGRAALRQRFGSRVRFEREQDR